MGFIDLFVWFDRVFYFFYSVLFLQWTVTVLVTLWFSLARIWTFLLINLFFFCWRSTSKTRTTEEAVIVSVKVLSWSKHPEHSQAIEPFPPASPPPPLLQSGHLPSRLSSPLYPRKTTQNSKGNTINPELRWRPFFGTISSRSMSSPDGAFPPVWHPHGNLDHA